MQGRVYGTTALDPVIVEALEFASAVDSNPENFPDPGAFQNIIRSAQMNSLAGEVLGAIWLRLGLILPQKTYSHCFGALSASKRIRVAESMLRVRKRMALRILGGKLLSRLLCDCDDPEFHRIVSAALNRVSVADAKDCLAYIRPENLTEVGVNLGRNMARQSVPLTDTALISISESARSMVMVGYAVEAMQRADVKASHTVMNLLYDSDREALADLIEKEIDHLFNMFCLMSNCFCFYPWELTFR